MDQTLLDLAQIAGDRLKARRETIAIAESSSGGLISAALLSVPGASAYYLGGGVIYTGKARGLLLDLGREDVAGMRSATEPYAKLLAATVRERFDATWGLSETGATGPDPNPYGDAPGHTAIAVAGPTDRAFTLETGQADRPANMIAFACEALRQWLAASA